MAKVKAIRDHFTDGVYRKEGEVFEHQGKIHEHIKKVGGKPEPDEEEETAGEKEPPEDK